MKTPLLKRAAIALLLLFVSLLITPVVGPAAFALPLAAALNYSTGQFVLGAYPNLNATTTANLVADTADAKEIKWVNSVLLDETSGALYQSAPLAMDGFKSRIRPGQKVRGNPLGKAVVELTETEKVAGDTIKIATRAGLASNGTTGESTRTGNEAKIHVGSYDLKIGHWFVAVSYTSIAQSRTFQGWQFDKWIRDELRAMHAKKKNDDLLMRLRQAAGTTIGGMNCFFPNASTTLTEATLKTANTISTDLISDMNAHAPSIGALPMDVSEDASGSAGNRFMLFGTETGLAPLKNEPAYLEAQKHAGDRGDMNRIFKGGFTDWDGTGIFRWQQPDHNNHGSLGSPLMPRARLGYALTGATTGSIVHGGGLACSTTVDNTNADATNTGDTGYGEAPNYFEFFEGAPYTFYNGDTIAAETTNLKYLLIINPDGSYGCYSYKVTNAKALIIFARVILGIGTETYTHSVHAEIVQCNVLGTAIGWSIFFGRSALVCGMGSMNGDSQSPRMGAVREKIEDYGKDLGVGVEGVWGSAVAKRAVDLVYPNFLYVTHAIPVRKAPVIV